MSRDAIKQQFKSTWLTTSFSMLLFVAVTYFLIWNENRTLKTSVALEEVLQKAVSVDIRQQEEGSQYEGQVVHVVGPLQVMEPLTEPDYNIQVLSVKLKKRVQMYQWIEETSGGETFGDTVVSNPSETTHWYHKDWRDYVVDSSLFYLSASHRNPRSIPIASETHIADNVKIGWLFLGLDLKRQVSDYYEITSDVRPEGTDIKLHGGMYYHAESPLDHQVGDLRVRFSYAGRADDIYTAVGLVEGATLVPYTAQSLPNAEPIALLRKGSSSLQQLVELERREAGASSWKYRAVGGFQVFASAMTLHPQWLTLLLQSRWISSGFRHASRLWVNIVLSLSYTLLVISLPWLFFKPTFALMLLGAAVMPLLHYSTILTTRPPDPASPHYRRPAHT